MTTPASRKPNDNDGTTTTMTTASGGESRRQRKIKDGYAGRAQCSIWPCVGAEPFRCGSFEAAATTAACAVMLGMGAYCAARCSGLVGLEFGADGVPSAVLFPDPGTEPLLTGEPGCDLPYG